MPFLDQIIEFINNELKEGSLKAKKLQPANFYGLATTVARIKDAKAKKDPEILPAIVHSSGSVTLPTPDQKYAVQVYHKLTGKTYSFVKKSYGDDHDVQMSCELTMVVFTNSKVTGKTKDALEPLVLFGMPQHLSSALLSELQINKCLITPAASNMDQVAVFRQEFPRSEYFLSDQMSMFSIKYKVVLEFSKSCIDACLCE